MHERTYDVNAVPVILDHVLRESPTREEVQEEPVDSCEMYVCLYVFMYKMYVCTVCMSEGRGCTAVEPAEKPEEDERPAEERRGNRDGEPVRQRAEQHHVEDEAGHRAVRTQHRKLRKTCIHTYIHTLYIHRPPKIAT